jgi:hypothetical protein
MSKYFKTKSTKRFNFEVSMNDTAKKAGSNTITIATRPEGGRYNSGGTSLTMTVREARALKTFLDDNIYLHSDSSIDSDSNIDV